MSEKNKSDPEISAELEVQLLSQIEEWEPALRKLLPSLPTDFDIVFDNQWLIPGHGTGGFASESDKIELAFEPDFDGNKKQQMIDFKASYYHESYHLVQGFVGNDETLQDVSALENAIYEGAATKFEMLRAGSVPPWGEYPKEVTDWVEELVNLDKETYCKSWRSWKFYDPETNRQYTMYRSGSYIVDQALEKSGKSIEALALLPPMEIYELGGNAR